VDTKPEFAQALQKLSKAYLNTGDYNNALDTIDKALKVTPENTELLITKSAALEKSGQYQDAVKYSDMVIQKTPHNIEALIIKSAALSKLQKYKVAIETLNQALEIEPEDIRIMEGLANTYWMNDQKTEASTLVDSILKKDEKNHIASSIKGKLLFDSGNYSDALKYINIALTSNQDDIELWLMSGTIHENLKEYQQALDAYIKANALDEKNFDSLYHQGLMYTKLGKLQEAVQPYYRASILDKKNVEVLEKLFELKIVLGLRYYDIRPLMRYESLAYDDEKPEFKIKYMMLTLIANAETNWNLDKGLALWIQTYDGMPLDWDFTLFDNWLATGTFKPEAKEKYEKCINTFKYHQELYGN